MIHRLPLQRKLMLIVLLTSSIALLLAASAFVVYELISFREAMKENLSSMAGMIADTSSAAVEFNDAATAAEILNSLRDNRHIVFACMYDRAGRPLAKYARSGKGFAAPAPQAESYRFGENRLEIFRPIYHKGERLGIIYIASDLEELIERLKKYLGIVVVVLVASMGVALVISSRLQRIISKPILKLAAVAHQVSKEKNYGLRVKQSSDDEIGRLMEGFNEMLSQIQQRDAALQAAHDGLELRVEQRTEELLQEVAERRRAEEGLQQQLTRINLLNSITRAIASRQSLESMVQTVLRQLEDHLPVAFGRVYLYDASSQTLNVCAHGSATCFKSPEGDLFPRSIPIEQTGMQACLKGETITCQNTEGVDSPVQMQLSRLGLRASVAVPLKVENELFAILLTARREENAFSSSECEFLRVLSEQVALAAHQARLHTQLQGAYDELRTTQQAVMQEERLRALGQMASGIAHDINNALCPIVVYSDLLLQGVSGLDKPIQKQLQNIKTAGEDIAHIVSRMREFYRKREGNEGLGPVSLNKLAIQVVDLTRPRWRDIPQARGITLQMDTELEPNLPDIQGNESELREALTNLILNSVDAMPDGGILALRTHVKGMDARNRDQRQHGHVVLEVCDSGIGMSEETRKHCLEPFFSTKGQHGTGLGLAMVYGIVERHEGHIEIESAIGKGTVMRIVFPVRAKQTEVVETSLRRPEPMPLLKVLCIDDEPLLREMLKQILETGGHQVEVADGGQAGLDLFRQARAGEKPFDVVITDLGMPHVDGNQVSKTLKRESSATPIIMLTGWGTIMKEDGDLPAQVDAVLCKPPKIAELYDVLRKVTTRKAA